MKRLIKLIVFLAVLAVAAVAAIYELFPDSAAAKFIDPYCHDYYYVARDWTLALVDRCRGGKDAAEPEEAAAEEPESANPSDDPDAKPLSKRAVENSLMEGTEDKRIERLSLNEAKWFTRRRVSEHDLRGKAVIVCVWNSDNPESLRLLEGAQRIMDGFRGKPMVVFASHRGGGEEGAAKILNNAEVDLPCCEGGGHPAEPRSVGKGPVYYLVDKTGNVKYFGRDDRAMTVRLVDIFSTP